MVRKICFHSKYSLSDLCPIQIPSALVPGINNDQSLIMEEVYFASVYLSPPLINPLTTMLAVVLLLPTFVFKIGLCCENDL